MSTFTDAAAATRARALGLGAALALAACLLLSGAPGAHAQEPRLDITPGSFFAKTHEPLPFTQHGGAHGGAFLAPQRKADLEALRDAAPVAQAGARPDGTTSFSLEIPAGPVLWPNPRDIEIDLPAGFVGNPTVATECARELLTADPENQGGTFSGGLCPPSAQVGIAEIDAHGSVVSHDGHAVAVYRVTPRFGAPASFGFRIGGQVVIIEPRIRSESDYGVTVEARNIAGHPVALLGATVTIWGVPADGADPGEGHFDDRLDNEGEQWGVQAGVPRRPFWSNPTRCDSGDLATDIRMRAWFAPERWLPRDLEPGDVSSPADYRSMSPEPTGCEQLSFGGSRAPVSFTMQPTNRTADTPSGYEAVLRLPYNDDPDGLANPTLRHTRVTLPEGVAVSPSAANGLGACSSEQIGLRGTDFPEPHPIRFTAESPRCPDSAKIGSLSVTTPLLDDPLEGDVYLAAQEDNPFGSLLATYLVIDDARRGLTIKLAGRVDPDPVTGRLTATFLNNPQLPLTEFRLRFFGGPGASLVNPPTCGTHTTTAELTPWSYPHSGPPAVTTDSFEITRGPNGQPCPTTLASRPFDLGLSAGMIDRRAGSPSPFVLRLTRPDGHQEIDSMQVMPPEGVSAYLKGIPLCSNAQANAGNCPAASRVGSAVTGAGPGPQPFFVRDGQVFLTGPYKGAPLGLLIQVPAKAGPFDLGMVDVRAAVHVDPQTAQLRVVSDPIPRILEGIPLRVRDIRVVMDRERFTVAPTSGDPSEVRARVHGSHGATADLSDRFQTTGAQNLDFAPGFNFRVRGRNSDRPNRRPRVVATVNFADDETSEANVKRASVTLPRRMIVDQDNIATTCTRAQFAAGECPNETRVGFARADSPLLDDPLRGPVYLIASGNPLPDIVADLRGIVNVHLFGRIHSAGIRVRNTFDVVPDVPVERFRLALRGGRDGILVNGANLCRQAKFRRVDVRVHAHNNENAHQRTFIRVNRCLRRRANQLERRAQRLRQRARQARSLGNGQRAQRMRGRANRLERRAGRVRSRLD